MNRHRARRTAQARGEAAGAGAGRADRAAAMALSDVPLKLFGISDPGRLGGKDWAADAIPHLLYGLVTYATIRATEDL